MPDAKLKGGLAAVAIVLVIVFSTVPVSAQQTNWVTVTSIKDITGNSTLTPSQQLLAGHAYNMSISIDVPNTSPSSFEVSLSRNASIEGSQYWYVTTPDYPGFNSSSFAPASRTTTFQQVQGHLGLNVLFSLGTNITLTQAGSLTLRFNRTNFPLITVTVVGGSNVGTVPVNISDETLQTYQSTYASKSTLLSGGSVSSTYASFVNGVLQQANDLANAGFPQNATALLGVLTASSFPSPPNTQYITYLYAGIGVLAVLVVVLLVLNLRKGSKYGLAKSVASDLEKELAALEVKTAQYDKAIADRLKSVREKLGEIE